MMKKRSVLGGLAAAPLFAALLGGCLDPSAADPILGGDEQKIEGGQLETGFPAVGLVSSAAGTCTGSLISPSVVMTANHCNGSSISFATGTSSADFVDRPVDRVIAHPSRDLLLLHLARPIRNIRPLDINTAAPPTVGSQCTAVGFGRHHEADGSITRRVKRSATERVTASSSAVISVAWTSGIVNHGDSGGPLICDGRISGEAWTIDQEWPDTTQGNYTTVDAMWVTNIVADYSSEPMFSTVAWGPNRLDTFARGVDGAVYHKWWNGSSWGPSVTGWEYMGGFTTGTPEVVSWGPNRLDVFVRGADLALYHKWWDGSAWGPSVTGWEYLGGGISGHVSAVSWGPNRLDIFVPGLDGALYHKWWDGSSWGPSVTGWEYMGGELMASIKSVSWSANRLDVFGVGMDNALYHKWWNGSAWGPSVTGYEYQGGGIVGSPVATAWGPNRLDVFVQGTDNALYHKWWNGAAWGPSLTDYEYMGGGLSGSPTVVSWDANRLDVFVAGTDFAQYHKWWNGAAWGPSVTGYEYMGGTISW